MGKELTLLTNNRSLGLSMSLWLANDSYDHDPEGAEGIDGLIVSATTLLKPTRSLILSSRNQGRDAEVDISSLGAARIGQSIHTSIETAFSSPNRDAILKQLGYSPGVIRNLRIDPTPEELKENPKIVPVYLEKRSFRQVTISSGVKIWISGKFDQLIAGSLEDNKCTKAYSYMKMDQSEKSNYGMQQSIYRWLNPEIVTSDMGKINFVLTDWKQGDVSRIKGYPSHQIMEMPVNLASLKDTGRFIINKLDEIEAAALLNEDQLPRCKDEELWKSPDKHKYYANADNAKKGGRSTKNFDTLLEANNYKITKGKGAVITVPGEVRRCTYCDGAPSCTQRLEYI